MLIKKRKNNYSQQLSLLFIKSNLKKRISIILVLFALLITYPLLILEYDKIHPTYQKGKIVIINNIEIINNYIKSFSEKTEIIYLDIKDLDFKKLEFIKKLSNENYQGFDNLDQVSLMRKEWVPAILRHNNNEYNIDIRIKGQSYDHWGKHGSYKIKLKNNKTLFGMKRFAIQHPKTRGFMNEWYYHKFLEYNNLISLRYKFLKIIVNGDTFPIFALEENFDKRLLENNNKKDGLIFRINFNLNDPIQFQQTNKEIQSNEFLIAQSEIVKKNLKLFFDKKLLASDVFDIPSLSKFYAIKDLWGNRHAGQLKNMRFYYNQLTSLIEPIGYDQQSVYPTQLLGLFGNNISINNSNNNLDYFSFLLSDSYFYSEYIKSLDKISSKLFLENFFEQTNKEADKQIKILFKSYPYFQFKSKYKPLLWPYEDINHLSYRDSLWLPKDKNILYENQNYIKSFLNLDNYSLTIKDIKKISKNNLLIEFTSNEQFPIQLNKIKIDNKEIKNDNNYIIYKNINNKLTLDISEISEFSNSSEIAFDYSLLGLDNIQTLKLNFFQEKNYAENIKKMNIKDLPKFSFLKINNLSKTITINSGNHIINKPLIIPSNYNLKIEPGTKINISKTGKIISYGPINFLGNENNKIHINSDTSSQGIVILNAKDVSNINFVKFSNLSNIDYAGIINTGALTFYNSDLVIKNSVIENSNSEDAINIVHSKFLIDNLIVINSKSDAIDLDFSNGIIKNSLFKNNGNDGIDVSAGIVKIENVKIQTSADKAISIGEKSIVNINFANIDRAFIGLAVKDKSIVRIDEEKNNSLFKGLNIENSNYGIALYQKKSEYGPSEVHIGNTGDHYLDLKFENVKDQFIVEKNSYLRIGPLNVKDYKNDVYKTLYPI